MARVPDLICAGGCGKKMWSGTTSLPQGKAMCRPCRTINWKHGTSTGYKTHKCRCDECKAYQAKAMRDYFKRLAKGQTNSKPCSETDCSRLSAARGLCRMHYHRWQRTNGLDKAPSNAWSDARRSNYHARRARMNGGRHGDKVMLSALLERDGYVCAACGMDIDTSLTYPHPLSPSIDHTHPVSRGGQHTLDNTTAMHLTCNLSKGAKVTD